MSDFVDAVEAAVESREEADDILRRVVSMLAAAPEITWAGIAFVEGESLALGPAGGTPDEGSRRRLPVRYGGDIVAELWIDGGADLADLERVCELIAALCLVGWDTGGKPWPAAG